MRPVIENTKWIAPILLLAVAGGACVGFRGSNQNSDANLGESGADAVAGANTETNRTVETGDPAADALLPADAPSTVASDSGPAPPTKLPKGSVCTNGWQCGSTFCVDGFCCDDACGDACSSCSAANTGQTNGTCAPARDGIDPHNDCSPMNANTCGNDGECNGAGACRRHRAGTPCAAAACTNNSTAAVPPRTCDGQGTCLPGIPATCGPYSCTAGQCRTSCATEGDCGANHRCTGGQCTPCGGELQPCCAGDRCGSPSLRCGQSVPYIETTGLTSDRCYRCGGDKEFCCAGDVCNSNVLGCWAPSGVPECAVCGGNLQPCCANKTCTSRALVCDPELHCTACGADGLRCCADGSCDAGFVCGAASVRCGPCGGANQRCCPGATACRDGALCVMNRCALQQSSQSQTIPRE